MLGEAAPHLSDDLRSAHPETPWREIIGARAILALAYFHIDQDIIGNVVQSHIPAIRLEPQQIIQSELTE